MKGFKAVRIPEVELSALDMGFRRSGRSTALIHKYIAMAMLNEGVWVEVKDHYPSTQADRELLRGMRDVVVRLGYEHFLFNLNIIGVKYEIEQEAN
jgi:hypothetical protein